ncbi:DfrB family trimethoprim-resistant dihydrofolate reductase [Sphingomonas sp. ABOLF]|uniref:DfrB family trimethoprim-resistant dihydrofolate reductase n=1 Tax=Sphingomonas sp. ABOLF TaxID=1985879 RepID=UPI000F7E2594|nr:DfrB family trimethoprim-resistant dihydrofolate reductase [Sphingomonas sp. ABOLF]RSV15810.1 DfrB family trimethoprim-resistant dihydrofolate reductase [Sphingomonas sp. ABOLF]
MQPRGEQQDWPADAAFPNGALVQKKGRASWRGKIVGWYRTDITALGYAVESAFEPGSVQIYPETALLAWDGERQAGREEVA